jgi:DNA mismatch repair protein MutL
VRQAYWGLLHHDRYPAHVLYLTFNSQLVDVNVPPTRYEVRFRESRLVHNFLFNTLKRAIAQLRPGENVGHTSHSNPKLIGQSRARAHAGHARAAGFIVCGGRII